MTWPLSAHLTTDLPLGVGDMWQNLWNFWWWKKALIELHKSPYRTGEIFFPFGARLAFQTHSEFNQLAMLPVSLLAGPIAAYNTAILAGFVLAGLGAYLLAREVTGDARAATLAGIVFAFFPHHMEQTIEHLNLATIQFLPLICLFAIRVVRYGGRANVLFLAGSLALNGLASWHYAIFVVLILPVLLPFELSSQPAASRRRAVRELLAGGVAATLLVSPFLWPMVHDIAAGQRYVKTFMPDLGIDPAFLFLPSAHNPILGRLTAHFYRAHRSYDFAGFLCYVGFTPLLLALAAWPAARQDRRLFVWYVMAAVFAVLALGAQLHVAGRPWHVVLPHALFRSLPLLQTLRIANRFIVVTMLALSVLAAVGARRLGRSKRGGLWLHLAAALILLEYLWLPYPLQRVDFPPYLRTLAADPTAGAVLDIPFCDHGPCVLNQAYQTVHGRPIAGGYISAARDRPVAMLKSDPVLSELFGMSPEVHDCIDVAHLRHLGFGTIILHTEMTSERLAQGLLRLDGSASLYRRRQFSSVRGIPRAALREISQCLEQSVGPPVYDDGRIRVFDLNGDGGHDQQRTGRIPHG